MPRVPNFSPCWGYCPHYLFMAEISQSNSGSVGQTKWPIDDLDPSEAEAYCSLIDACNEGDLEAVRRLLEEGRNANEVNEEGESLLSLACSSGFLELAQLLLATRANVEDRGLKETTPLMEAASAGHEEIVKLLLHHVSTAFASYLASSLTVDFSMI